MPIPLLELKFGVDLRIASVVLKLFRSFYCKKELLGSNRLLPKLPGGWGSSGGVGPLSKKFSISGRLGGSPKKLLFSEKLAPALLLECCCCCCC